MSDLAFAEPRPLERAHIPSAEQPGGRARRPRGGASVSGSRPADGQIVLKADFSSMFVYRGPRPQTVAEYFGELGTVLKLPGANQ